MLFMNAIHRVFINNLFSLGFFVLISFANHATCQELSVDLKVVVPNNLKADPAIFKAIERTASEFMNSTQWSTDVFTKDERINTSMQILIKEELSATSFSCDLIVQASRPVYNTNYETPVLNYVDKGLIFSFNEGQPILRSENVFYDNLSSTLTYFAYLLLGLDYDTFSPFGGDKFFNIARDVFLSLPVSLQSNDPGWQNTGIPTPNKYWIVESLLNPKVRPYRQAIYEYHMMGLDRMLQDADRQRAVMLGNLSMIEDSYTAYQNAAILQVFAETKRLEIVEVFKVADKGQKNKVLSIMAKLDAANQNRYDDLRR